MSINFSWGKISYNHFETCKMHKGMQQFLLKTILQQDSRRLVYDSQCWWIARWPLKKVELIEDLVSFSCTLNPSRRLTLSTSRQHICQGRDSFNKTLIISGQFLSYLSKQLLEKFNYLKQLASPFGGIELSFFFLL